MKNADETSIPTTECDSVVSELRGEALIQGEVSEALQLAGVKLESRMDGTSVASGGIASSASQKETINSEGLKGRPNAFAQLVRGWEAYLNDADTEAFPSFQMLQSSLQLCGPAAAAGIARIAAPPSSGQNLHLQNQFLAPPALRHTHSSPLNYGKSIFDQEGDNVPPPIPLDPFQRSSSTPSSFRQRSMNSAFTMPSQQRASYTSVSQPGFRLSAFDPVKYYASALEDMERTSIEVMDVSTEPLESSNKEGRKGAASRAARFLSDVRTLRRRRRARGGRENPVQPASISSSSTEDNNDENAHALDTSVTVITEPNPNETSMLSRSSEVSAILGEAPVGEKDEPFYSAPVSESDPEDERHISQPYQQLESDGDEDELHIRPIESTVPAKGPALRTPSYQRIVDERLVNVTEKQALAKLSFKLPEGEKDNSSTPSPSRMIREGSSTNDSPGMRSAGTGSSSGHTTQATFSSGNTGLQSGLSTISETDREVMEANKEGKRLRVLSSIITSHKEPEGGSLNSTSTTSSIPNGYLALDNSPMSLREGANLPAYRFFTTSPTGDDLDPSNSAALSHIPLSTRRSAHSGSTTTVETSSATQTSSSGGSSTEDKPPTFVSYFDRQNASDLTLLREGISSQRADVDRSEEREDSPADLVAYPELFFEQANLARGRPDRLRSRPPRSPTKGLRHLTTPPPRGSVSPLQQVSPPRNIVDHPDSSLSRPHVTRTSATGQTFVAVNALVTPVAETGTEVVVKPDSPRNFLEDELPSSRGSMRGRTYADGSVEILKSSSKEDVSPSPPTLVTPEKADAP